MPDPGAWIGVISILGALLLVVSASRRRMPARSAWRYALVWAAIFTALFAAALLLGSRD